MLPTLQRTSLFRKLSLPLRRRVSSSTARGLMERYRPIQLASKQGCGPPEYEDVTLQRECGPRGLPNFPHTLTNKQPGSPVQSGPSTTCGPVHSSLLPTANSPGTALIPGRLPFGLPFDASVLKITTRNKTQLFLLEGRMRRVQGVVVVKMPEQVSGAQHGKSPLPAVQAWALGGAGSRQAGP